MPRMSAIALPFSAAAPRAVTPPLIEDALEGAVALIAMSFPAGELNVLEAGGGSVTALAGLRGARFTAIDISPEQLERNGWAHTKLLGDLQTFAAYPQRYQVVVCRDVLEHLDDPQAALANLLGALAPGGLLMVAGPVPTSFKGLVTKFTPHALHVAYYRWILREPHAGEPGRLPFKAHLNLSVGPEALKAAAAAAQLCIVYEALTPPSWAVSQMRRISPLLSGAYAAAMWALRLLTLGMWRPDLSDMVLVFRRD